MKVQELYLLCTNCQRIPDWTSVKTSTDNGKTTTNYEFSGVCPFCKGGKFELVEVTNGEREHTVV